MSETIYPWETGTDRADHDPVQELHTIKAAASLGRVTAAVERAGGEIARTMPYPGRRVRIVATAPTNVVAAVRAALEVTT